MSDINTFRYKTIEERQAESQAQLEAQAAREQEKMAYDREARAQARMEEYDAKRAKWKSGGALPKLQGLGQNVDLQDLPRGQQEEIQQIKTNKPAASLQEFWNRYNTWLNVGREQAAQNALNKQYITMVTPKEGVIATDASTGERKLYQPGEKYKALASGKTPLFPGNYGWVDPSQKNKIKNNTAL
jgi:hypothetical protein